MIPVDQTTFGRRIEDGENVGDCWRACAASLLEVPAPTVPHVMMHTDWMERFNAWLAEHHGLFVLTIQYDAAWAKRSGWAILTGRSPRADPGTDQLHSVVGHAGAIVHDPHPSRAGLADIRELSLLVPLDPRARLPPRP